MNNQSPTPAKKRPAETWSNGTVYRDRVSRAGKIVGSINPPELAEEIVALLNKGADDERRLAMIDQKRAFAKLLYAPLATMQQERKYPEDGQICYTCGLTSSSCICWDSDFARAQQDSPLTQAMTRPDYVTVDCLVCMSVPCRCATAQQEEKS